MIKEQFIQVENTEKFKEQLENGEISNQSIAFLKDTNQIWTQDKYYHCDDVLDDSGKIKKELLDRAIDLSYRDINGNVLATQNTANCYVIKEPGTYKFPLVYGNAIKNGQVNTAAYTNIEPDNENMGDFINVDGNPISNPWIAKDLGTSLTPAFKYIIGLNNVYISEGYIYFTLENTENTEAAVYSLPVAVYVDEPEARPPKISRIAWQWTIWYYPKQLTTIDIYNATGVKYQVLSENLAETQTEEKWYFQGGRYSVISSKATRSNARCNLKDMLSRGCYSIPDYSDPTFTSSDFCDDWIKLNYWNAAQTASGVSDVTVVKTVYDPCPVGFVVPPASVFTGMSLIKWISNAEARYTRYPGDTTGIYIIAPAMYDQYLIGSNSNTALEWINEVSLLTSSVYIDDYRDYGNTLYTFRGTKTDTDIMYYRVVSIPRKIRPIAEN